MISRRVWITSAAGTAVIAIAVAVWLGRGSGSTEAMRPVQATLGLVEDTVETTGEVRPLNRVEVTPPISGRIEKLLVSEGSYVKAGDVIGWMSSSDRAAILDAARAKGPEEFKIWEGSYKPTPIITPLSGVVILRDVVVGQAVGTGTVVYAISDELIVIASVDESDIGRVRNGIPARIILDAYPDRVATGRVLSILHEGKNVSNVVTYGEKIRMDQVPSYFRSQMSANINLVVLRKENAVLVPDAAVKQGRRGESFVLVPGSRGRPMPQPVKTGVAANGQIEIVSGLEPGGTVYITSRKYTRQRGVQGSPLTPGAPAGAQRGGSRQSGGTGGPPSRP
jgi:macrolide-specific efflux system membrane fusion protein